MDEDVVEFITKPQGHRALIRNKRLFRRQMVSSWLLKGYTFAKILAVWNDEHPEFGCSLETIKDDIEALQRQWKATASFTTEQAIQRELQKLDGLEDICEELTNQGETKDAGELLLKVIKSRRCLLGLDKAKKVAILDARASDLTDEDIDRMLKELHGEVEQRSDGPSGETD
jgi:hypothetical protein